MKMSLPTPPHSSRPSRHSGRRRGAPRSIAAIGGALLALAAPSLVFAATEARPDPDALEFQVDGVGRASFETAVVAPHPGKGENGHTGLCMSLEGGSRSNTPDMLKWVGSNSAGGALASKPDATLTVPVAIHGLAAGTYHLHGITVGEFTQKADRDLTHPRLAGVQVKCESMEAPAA